MSIGFCYVVDPADAELTLSILKNHGRVAQRSARPWPTLRRSCTSPSATSPASTSASGATTTPPAGPADGARDSRSPGECSARRRRAERRDPGDPSGENCEAQHPEQNPPRASWPWAPALTRAHARSAGTRENPSRHTLGVMPAKAGIPGNRWSFPFWRLGRTAPHTRSAPLPLVGRGWGGGPSWRTRLRPTTATPTPPRFARRPSPQGGG